MSSLTPIRVTQAVVLSHLPWLSATHERVHLCAIPQLQPNPGTPQPSSVSDLVCERGVSLSDCQEPGDDDPSSGVLHRVQH